MLIQTASGRMIPDRIDQADRWDDTKWMDSIGLLSLGNGSREPLTAYLSISGRVSS